MKESQAYPKQFGTACVKHFKSQDVSWQFYLSVCMSNDDSKQYVYCKYMSHLDIEMPVVKKTCKQSIFGPFCFCEKGAKQTLPFFSVHHNLSEYIYHKYIIYIYILIENSCSSCIYIYTP